MTSSGLIRFLYIAFLTVLVERVRTDSALPSSSSADRKDTDSGGETDNGNLISADEEKTAVADGAVGKRKWGENTMMAWGKRPSVMSNAGDLLLTPRNPPCGSSPRDRRRWSEKSMSVWGKRCAGGGIGCEEDDVSAAAMTEKIGKRKWGEKTMQVWGKRLSSVAAANEEEANEDVDETNVESQKRKWGENSMSAWGKRQHGMDEEATGGVKRKWGSNSMMVWGKREQLLRNEEPAEEWSHTVARRGTDAGINDIIDNMGHVQEQKLATIRSNEYGAGSGNVQAARPRGWHRRHGVAYWGPKRKWETNTLKVWGKRTPGESDWRGVRTVDAE